ARSRQRSGLRVSAWTCSGNLARGAMRELQACDHCCRVFRPPCFIGGLLSAKCSSSSSRRRGLIAEFSPPSLLSLPAALAASADLSRAEVEFLDVAAPRPTRARGGPDGEGGPP